MISYVLYITVIFLFLLALTAILFRRNLIKIVIALNIAEHSINLFFISLAYRPESTAPIFTLAPALDDLRMVLPVPQALILTNIVIGFATTALMLVLVGITYKNNGTLDVRRLKGRAE